ncbi:MAG: hypothetical protein ACLT8E_02830 [Akkermansia sp.]
MSRVLAPLLIKYAPVLPLLKTTGIHLFYNRVPFFLVLAATFWQKHHLEQGP